MCQPTTLVPSIVMCAKEIDFFTKFSNLLKINWLYSYISSYFVDKVPIRLILLICKIYDFNRDSNSNAIRSYEVKETKFCPSTAACSDNRVVHKYSNVVIECCARSAIHLYSYTCRIKILIYVEVRVLKM